MKTTKQLIGEFGEKAAVRYLRRKHYRILDRNYRYRHLELDIVAKNKTDIVFVEVKTRSFDDPNNIGLYGPPSAAVDAKKRKNTLDAMYAYLREFPSDLHPRIDVIEVYLFKNTKKFKVAKINHYENAVTRRNSHYTR